MEVLLCPCVVVSQPSDIERTSRPALSGVAIAELINNVYLGIR